MFGLLWRFSAFARSVLFGGVAVEEHYFSTAHAQLLLMQLVRLEREFDESLIVLDVIVAKAGHDGRICRQSIDDCFVTGYGEQAPKGVLMLCNRGLIEIKQNYYLISPGVRAFAREVLGGDADRVFVCDQQRNHCLNQILRNCSPAPRLLLS